MNIVCATSVLFGEEAFSQLGDLVRLPERDITPEVVKDADLVIARSKLPLNRDLLAGSQVRFAATATAGFDHVHAAEVEDLDIAWTAAPGCNANSVAEYVVAALLCLAHRQGFSLSRKTLGVVGVGHVGRRVVDKARALGMVVLQNDPPRRAAENNPELISLADLLPHADIVTLHVPLTYLTQHATYHMTNGRFFAVMQPGTLFVNACRGEVTDTESLLHALDFGQVGHAVLDVWEDEPACRLSALQRAAIGTPHIAGYSLEGRADGTLMVYRAACGFLEVPATWTWRDLVQDPDPIRIDARGLSDEEALWEIVRRAYDIEADDRTFRSVLDPDDQVRAQHFRSLRARYPERREFDAFRVEAENAGDTLLQKMAALGFRTGG